jgi:hypothetical protein
LGSVEDGYAALRGGEEMRYIFFWCDSVLNSAESFGSGWSWPCAGVQLCARAIEVGMSMRKTVFWVFWKIVADSIFLGLFMAVGVFSVLCFEVGE